jgi:hypothetical protein
LVDFIILNYPCVKPGGLPLLGSLGCSRIPGFGGCGFGGCGFGGCGFGFGGCGCGFGVGVFGLEGIDLLIVFDFLKLKYH